MDGLVGASEYTHEVSSVIEGAGYEVSLLQVAGTVPPGNAL